MRSILIVSTMLFVASVNAATIDIDLGAAPCDFICSGTYELDGFDISTDSAFRNLGFWGFDFEQVLTMERSTGDSFGLSSIGASINLNGPWIVTGHYALGGIVQTSIDTSGVFSFDGSWQNLTRVEFVVQPGSLSSLAATVVPVPAAAWLFASALAGLGWLRRRRVF